MVSEDLKDKTVCVVGLGYVGLPLGVMRDFFEQFEDRCTLTDVYSNGYRDKTTEKQRHREKTELNHKEHKAHKEPAKVASIS